MTATSRALDLAQLAARAADSKQGEDIVALDVSEPLPLTDVFVLVTGRNERNVQAIAAEVEEKMIEAGVKPLRREGRAEGRWILIDFGDVIVHIFRPEEREYYQLEDAWAGATETVRIQ